ncbi:phosphoribosylamine--glycine ligase, partial [Candidatus Peregrinibacteria bacterium]|nr:phosphoribosylamine--glycine ligase [Candidatus Peregrinibacteria bacterium]
GMGTFTDVNHSLPFLETSDLARGKELNRLVADALIQECSSPYTGILYGGFIAVKDGIRVIEYNARFGDPEALNILPLLQSDFVDICTAIIDGDLDESMVSFAPRATVCKYITPDCYPESKDRKGEAVVFPEATPDTRIFYGDIREDADGTLRLGGSRTAGIVGIGDSIAKAEAAAQRLCEKVKGPVRFRKDIGTAALMKQRIDLMRQIRN